MISDSKLIALNRPWISSMQDLTSISTSDLDDLLRAAAAERGSRKQPFPEAPENVFGALNPRWVGDAGDSQLRMTWLHPAYGWIGFGWDRLNLAELMGYLTRTALSGVLDQNQLVATTVAPVTGGGTIH